MPISCPSGLNTALRLDVPYPSRWQLYEYIGNAVPLLGEGRDQAPWQIGALVAGAQRKFVWSFVLVSNDPDTAVYVTASVLQSGKVVASQSYPLTVKKPTTTKSLHITVEGM